MHRLTERTIRRPARKKKNRAGKKEIIPTLPVVALCWTLLKIVEYRREITCINYNFCLHTIDESHAAMFLLIPLHQGKSEIKAFIAQEFTNGLISTQA